MKKLFLFSSLFFWAIWLQGQTSVYLNLPNPCSISNINETNSSKNFLDFNIMPNPSTGIFTLEIKSAKSLGLLVVKLTSMDGKTTYNEQLYSAQKQCVKTFNVSHLKGGTYILSVSSKKEKIAKKIIIKKY